MCPPNQSADKTTHPGHFSLRDFLIITLLAALGLATKSFLNPLSRTLLGALSIPGGVFFGGLYMMWLALARGIVKKPGSAILTAFVQGVVALVLGLSPVQGLLSALIYLPPGVLVDLAFLIPGQAKFNRLLRFTLACLAANVSGIALVALALGIVHGPLILLVIVGALSGALGGLLAFVISEKIPSRSPQPSV
jgi:energy-coupling factor transport system substrate-specific component